MTEAAPHRAHGGDGGRLPPHNLEAERSVLGALLLDVHTASPALQILGDDDFYLEPHQRIFHAIVDLYDRLSSADLVLVTDALSRQGQLEKVGGEAYILRLVEEVPSAANAARIFCSSRLFNPSWTVCKKELFTLYRLPGIVP